MPRSVPEWIGKNDDAMPSIDVQLRICERQGNICACGCMKAINFETDELDCDHRTPLADGGENRESNLQIIIRKCHRKKTAAENSARSAARRHKGKAFTNRRQKPGSFATNRNGKFKKRMDGTVVLR